jgi:hypothetical protein
VYVIQKARDQIGLSTPSLPEKVSRCFQWLQSTVELALATRLVHTEMLPMYYGTRESHMIERHKRTGIFIMDDGLWNWAQYRAKQLGKESVSQYLFDLMRDDKKKAK